ncbi:hypothetical protein MJO28_002644 [Puccinia striiformis f. sp. tritici]|uniref:Uncharacterized protein n=2 Tax=Puccinia striiformis TaxID=27350 RepID=A0A2S4VLU4_9BASI|nr:hypothetical protein MJO28_002644 [Puccinia striiformis f. sp. tritici]POW10418.1 hypothetical protein PSTT_06081 [Puccinia striiformis]
MSIDKESDPAACFLGLSQRLSDIFKLTSHRLSLISKSLSASIDSQLALPSQLNLPEPPSLNPKDRPGHSANTQTETHSQHATQLAELPSVAPAPLPVTGSDVCSKSVAQHDQAIGSILLAGLKRENQTPPQTPSTPPKTLKGVADHIDSRTLGGKAHTCPIATPPQYITSPRDHDQVLPLKPRSVKRNPTEGKPLSMNLLERIASPPAPVGAGSDPASPPLVQSVDSRYSPSPQSSPMDMRESDLSKEVSPRAERRVSSPVSSSRRADDSSYNQSSRTRSSYSRRSRSPSSRSSDWRYRRASLRSPSRRESIAHQPSRRPYTYDSYHPTQSSSRTYRPRSRSPSRSRRERSNSTRVSPSRFLDRIDTRETRFLDRIESRQDRDFAEYLEKDRGDPSYERLILILRRLHGSNFARSIISLDLWEEFHRFRNRTDTREERMLRHLHIYPELMHRYLCCACERKVITYWPDHKSLKSSTIKLDISHRPAAR